MLVIMIHNKNKLSTKIIQMFNFINLKLKDQLMGIVIPLMWHQILKVKVNNN